MASQILGPGTYWGSCLGLGVPTEAQSPIPGARLVLPPALTSATPQDHVLWPAFCIALGRWTPLSQPVLAFRKLNNRCPTGWLQEEQQAQARHRARPVPTSLQEARTPGLLSGHPMHLARCLVHSRHSTGI